MNEWIFVVYGIAAEQAPGIKAFSGRYLRKGEDLSPEKIYIKGVDDQRQLVIGGEPVAAATGKQWAQELITELRRRYARVRQFAPAGEQASSLSPEAEEITLLLFDEDVVPAVLRLRAAADALRAAAPEQYRTYEEKVLAFACEPGDAIRSAELAQAKAALINAAKSQANSFGLAVEEIRRILSAKKKERKGE